ncbi:MAG: UDP-N-acetylglucosamine 1-carboxyvinyltransferase [Clostridia bacterium]|nr:UDP-N-acetylglucosamine 1-carboxyvinyltransferase [Clostridia bacterium]
MQSIIIEGGRQLCGEIDVQGSKNSALPILAATVLIDGISVIRNCPLLSDVDAAVSILRYLGCRVVRSNHTVTVDSRGVSGYRIPEFLMREMRSSIVFLGSVLGRTGKAMLTSPGGCEIGLRPIDLHLTSLRKLGAEIEEVSGEIVCSMPRRNTDRVISLSFPSVGATENIILASALSSGRTVIHNGAREPEISDLARFLCSAGCNIEVGNDGDIIIDGASSLHGCEHSVIPDRIVALTYLCAGAAAGGELTLNNVDVRHFSSVLPILEGSGCTVKGDSKRVTLEMKKRPRAMRDIRTMPYPGFPTDAQAPFMAVASVARGTSVIVENIFESRFKHVSELARFGAKIKIEGKIAIIDGVSSLHGAKAVCPDLRGGAALVIAGLAAHGRTVITGLGHIDRGYEKIEENLRLTGADIVRRTLVGI